MSNYRILFLGDIVGKPGRRIVQEGLPSLKEQLNPLFTIVNGENSAGGVGITPDIAEELFRWGVDAITLGNHAFNKRDIGPYLTEDIPICRPSNMPSGTPGSGQIVITKGSIELSILNLCGRVFMESYDDPFAEVDRLIGLCPSPHILLDFHAEATSEKQAMGYHVDGRVSAMIGTHTHVPTADERILSNGTAYITDVGMCGPEESVLGMDRRIIVEKFRTTMPAKFEVQNSPGVISGVWIDVEIDTGRATAIERIQFGATK